MSLPVVSVTARGRPVVVVTPGQRSVVESVTVPGEQGPPGPSGTGYDYLQPTPAAVWTIAHHLGRYPSVTLIDSAGDLFDGDVRYADANTLTVTLNAPTAGTAHLT